MIRAAILLSFGADSTNRIGTLLYYFISATLVAIAAALYFVDRKNLYARHHIELTKIAPDEMVGPKPCCYKFTLMWHNSKVPLQKTFWMLFHVGFSMLVTFVVFPGVMEATSIPLVTNRAWFELLIVTLFNVFDTIGRYMGGIKVLMFKEKGAGIHIVGFGRIAGIAVAIMIMMQVFGGSWAVLLNTIFFAVTNGYV